MSHFAPYISFPTYSAVATYPQDNPAMLTFEQVEARYRDLSQELMNAIADVELRGKKESLGILLFRELRVAKVHTPQSLMDILRLYNPNENCLEPKLTFDSRMGNKVLRYAYRLTKDEVESISNRFLRVFAE